jgi:formylglycine-generating enzyme required for sulfatase activity
MTCPRCGSVLRRADSKTPLFLCSQCNEIVGDTTSGQLTLPEGAPAADFAGQVPGYEILGELGRGGMGIVYRARQASLRREVALKVLPPALAANPDLLVRFRHEADVAGNLVNAHILPVHDVLDAGGVPVIVLPLVDGGDLGRILRDRKAVAEGKPAGGRHPWSVLDDRTYQARVLPLLDQLVEGVAALHRAGILHRDIKPSNVLVDREGHAWLSDFGLARTEEQGLGTQLGMMVGTQGYLSPEQARGEPGVDKRADVFSLGVTLYQALTLEMPYGPGGAAARRTPPAPPSRRQPLLPRHFDGVLLKAMAPRRENRFASAVEFQEEWRRARQGQRPRTRPPRRLLPWAVAAAALGAAVVLVALRAAGLWPAPAPAPPDGRAVYVETDPPGARVALVPVAPNTGWYLADKAIRPRGRTPLTVPDVPPGEYLVVADVPGHGFHEVFRTVPPSDRSKSLEAPAEYTYLQTSRRPDGSVALSLIKIPRDGVTEGMAFYQGREFTVGREDVPTSPPWPVDVRDFYLDRTEVTVADYRARTGGLPHDMLRDSPDDAPVAYVSYDAAVQYAEGVGKRLMDEVEYEFAATNRGETRFPWGDEPMFPPWPLGRVREPGHDRTRYPEKAPVYGLYSNVAEWTSSRPYPYPVEGMHEQLKQNPFRALEEQARVSRVVRGGPFSVMAGKPTPDSPRAPGEWDPRYRAGYYAGQQHPGLGFRCARSARPRFLDDESLK